MVCIFISFFYTGSLVICIYIFFSTKSKQILNYVFFLTILLINVLNSHLGTHIYISFGFRFIRVTHFGLFLNFVLLMLKKKKNFENAKFCLNIVFKNTPRKKHERKKHYCLNSFKVQFILL